jgi:hypothetical protein
LPVGSSDRNAWHSNRDTIGHRRLSEAVTEQTVGASPARH